MNILLVNYEYPPIGAGAGNATRHLALALQKLGHQPTVLTAAFRDLRGTAVEDGLTIIRLPALRQHEDRATVLEMASFTASALLHVATLQGKYDAAIIFFSIPCGPIGLALKWVKGIPFVTSLRGGDVPGAEASIGPVHSLLMPLRRLILQQSRAVVANSQGLADLSRAADPFPVAIVPNGVDADFFQPPALPKTSPELRILFVGRFQTQKNLPFVLRTFARLRERCGPARLILVGDGPLRPALEMEARVLGLGDHVEWLGWLDKPRLRAQYQQADFLVNLSLYEGMPNVILEGMACGLPALVSRVPGHLELVQPDATGFVCALESEPEIDEAWLALATEPALRQRLGQAAAATVRKAFTWQSCALSYVHLMENLPLS